MEDGLLNVAGSLLLDVVDEAHVVFFEVSELFPNALPLLELLLHYSVDYLLLLIAVLQLDQPLPLGRSYHVSASAALALGNKGGLDELIQFEGIVAFSLQTGGSQ